MDAAAVVDLFAPFGPVAVRRMFGGLGIFAEGRMIGLVAAGEIYLKTDAETRPAFEAAGSRPFSYESRGRTIGLPYLSLPEAALDDEAALVRYAGLAREAALRGPAKAARRKGRAGGGENAGDDPGRRGGARPRRPPRAET